MMVFPSYRQSQRVRNLLLVIAVFALFAVGYKLYATTETLRYMKAAEAAYLEKEYGQAESYYRLASLPFAIKAGDAQLEEGLSSLILARKEAVTTLQELEEAASLSEPDELLPAYQRYLQTKKNYAGTRPASLYFQDISKTFELDKKWTAVFTQIKEQAYQQMQQNIKKDQYQQEAFLHTLVMIPSSFFGGQEAKDRELAKRFRQYDEAKFAYLLERQEFVQWVSALYSSWKQYDQEGIAPVWLKAIAEKQGRRVLQSDLRTGDLASFIKHAKDYGQIFSLFSGDSQVQRLIQETMEKELGRARSFMDKGLFDQAKSLYEELSSFTSTSDAIEEVEAQWVLQDPMRLLNKQFPDKQWVHSLTGKKNVEGSVYAVGLSEENQLFYAERKADGSITQFETAVEEGMEVRSFTLTDALLKPAVPVLMIEAKGKERAARYLGFAIGESAWEQVLSLEADRLQIEEPNRLVVENPVGDGEQAIAYYVWKDGKFVYDGMKEELMPSSEETEESVSPLENDASPESTEPAPPLTEDEYFLQQETPIYTGPGEEYEVIGKLDAGTVVKAVEESDGWIKVAFDVGEYWIKRP